MEGLDPRVWFNKLTWDEISWGFSQALRQKIDGNMEGGAGKWELKKDLLHHDTLMASNLETLGVRGLFDYVSILKISESLRWFVSVLRYNYNNQYWLIVAFINWNSNLVPLLEDLCSSNPCRFEFSGFWAFAEIELTTSRLTVPRSDQLS